MCTLCMRSWALPTRTLRISERSINTTHAMDRLWRWHVTHIEGTVNNLWSTNTLYPQIELNILKDISCRTAPVSAGNGPAWLTPLRTFKVPSTSNKSIQRVIFNLLRWLWVTLHQNFTGRIRVLDRISAENVLHRRIEQSSESRSRLPPTRGLSSSVFSRRSNLALYLRSLVNKSF